MIPIFKQLGMRPKNIGTPQYQTLMILTFQKVWTGEMSRDMISPLQLEIKGHVVHAMLYHLWPLSNPELLLSMEKVINMAPKLFLTAIIWMKDVEADGPYSMATFMNKILCP